MARVRRSWAIGDSGAVSAQALLWLLTALLLACHNGSAPRETPRAPARPEPQQGNQQDNPGGDPQGPPAEVLTDDSPSGAPAEAPASTAAEPPGAADTVADALAYDPADPLAQLERADVLDGPRTTRKADHGPCQALGPLQRLWPRPASMVVAVAGPDFVVAGYATKPSVKPSAKPAGGAPTDRADRPSGGEQVFVLALAEQGAPRPLRTLDIHPPHPRPRQAAPGLAARDDSHVTLAVVDGAGKLGIQTIELTSPRASLKLRSIATGVDSRFSPAVDHVDSGTLVAFTEGSTPMRMHVALIPPEPEKSPTMHDVTPPQMGAAAPTFVRGGFPPALYAVDARDGMSPLLRVAISHQGKPSPAEVVVPVGMVASPTQLAVARADFGTVLGYVGIGSAATTAIGVIDVAPKPGSPSALVKGIAYVPLSVSAAPARDAVYFAADAPRKAGKSPPREVHLVRVDGQGRRDTTVLEGPSGDAHGAAIARNGVGTVLVAFSGGAGAYAARYRCK